MSLTSDIPTQKVLIVIMMDEQQYWRSGGHRAGSTGTSLVSLTKGGSCVYVCLCLCLVVRQPFIIQSTSNLLVVFLKKCSGVSGWEVFSHCLCYLPGLFYMKDQNTSQIKLCGAAGLLQRSVVPRLTELRTTAGLRTLLEVFENYLLSHYLFLIKFLLWLCPVM